MKKLYTIIATGFLLTLGGKSFSQTTFEFYTPDTIVYSDTLTGGDIEIDWDYIRNKTAAACTIDVVRLIDVGGTWTSAFCLDVCYAPFVDSVRYILPASDSITFIPHFYIDATPDSQSVYFKVKNANLPTDVAYQRFYAVTKIGYGAGIHEYANLANVSIYPSPVTAGNDFQMNITNVKTQNKNLSLTIYNIYGGVVRTINGLHEGNNTLNLDLASGIYSYSLTSGNVRIRSGEIVVTR